MKIPRCPNKYPCGNCDICLRYKGYRIVRLIMNECDEHEHNKFVTLTTPDATDDEGRNIPIVSRPFLKTYFQRLRDAGHTFRYRWCEELTKRGVPHWHLAIHSHENIPKRHIEELWCLDPKDENTRFITHVRNFEHADGADYIAKYINKGFKTQGSENYGHNKPMVEIEKLAKQIGAIIIPNATTGKLPYPQRQRIVKRFWDKYCDTHPL